MNEENNNEDVLKKMIEIMAKDKFAEKYKICDSVSMPEKAKARQIQAFYVQQEDIDEINKLIDLINAYKECLSEEVDSISNLWNEIKLKKINHTDMGKEITDGPSSSRLYEIMGWSQKIEKVADNLHEILYHFKLYKTEGYIEDMHKLK